MLLYEISQSRKSGAFDRKDRANSFQKNIFKSLFVML